MRSYNLSTHLQRPTLALIFTYGREALGNRRKLLLSIAFLFVFCPQLLIYLAWAKASSGIKQELVNTASLAPLAQILALFQGVTRLVALPSLIGAALLMVGVLALARTSVDYFESRPDGFKQILARALRVLLTKGLGVFVLLTILLPALTILPLLRAVAMSMLVMLPVTLVANTNGGFKTTWDTLLLKYASQTKYGRWPTFINVLSMTGLFLTALFGVTLLINLVSSLDAVFELPAGFLANDVTFAGLTINCGWMLSAFLGLIWESVAIAVIMPFMAAIYHLSTVPEGHTPFEAQA